MARSIMTPAFKIERDENRCIKCGVCVRQCTNEVHHLDDDGWMWADDEKCVACQRCAVLCPTRALSIIEFPMDFRSN
ncbi:MAG: 4Fe-4S binding protein, partial [Syntrophomonadaceae bacterium]|nr:4Fe-4S binding protein [Syntrophomonadaceae bacterium]